MATLYQFICPDCGWSIEAPDNNTGRYCLMSGTIQLFLDKDAKEVDSVMLGSDYLKQASHSSPLTPWNAKTGRCPKCGGKLMRPDWGYMVCAD